MSNLMKLLTKFYLYYTRLSPSKMFYVTLFLMFFLLKVEI